MTSKKMKIWNLLKNPWMTIVYILLGITLVMPLMYWLMNKTFTSFISDACPHFQHGMKHVCDKTLNEFQAYSQSVGTLFTGLAFAGLLVTILQQKKQIKSAKDQNKKQLFETEIQNLLALLHQKKQDITIYRGDAIEQTKKKGEEAFIKIIENFEYLIDEKKSYEDIKSFSRFSEEINCLSPCWEKASQYETIERCVLYDIGVIRSWAATFYLAICRINEYCEETRTDRKNYINLLKSNLNRNEKLFLEFSRNQREYQQDDIIRQGLPLAEKYGIIDHPPHIAVALKTNR